jgi:hypothetical protein
LGAVRTWAGASMESRRRVKVAQAIFFDMETSKNCKRSCPALREEDVRRKLNTG